MKSPVIVLRNAESPALAGAGCRGCVASCWSAKSEADTATPISVSRIGLNTAALCIFGLPLVCLTVAVTVYEVYWGAGDELFMLGVVAALIAVSAVLLRPWQNEFIDLMSIADDA